MAGKIPGKDPGEITSFFRENLKNAGMVSNKLPRNKVKVGDWISSQTARKSIVYRFEHYKQERTKEVDIFLNSIRQQPWLKQIILFKDHLSISIDKEKWSCNQ